MYHTSRGNTLAAFLLINSSRVTYKFRKARTVTPQGSLQPPTFDVALMTRTLTTQFNTDYDTDRLDTNFLNNHASLTRIATYTGGGQEQSKVAAGQRMHVFKQKF